MQGRPSGFGRRRRPVSGRVVAQLIKYSTAPTFGFPARAECHTYGLGASVWSSDIALGRMRVSKPRLCGGTVGSTSISTWRRISRSGEAPSSPASHNSRGKDLRCSPSSRSSTGLERRLNHHGDRRRHRADGLRPFSQYKPAIPTPMRPRALSKEDPFRDPPTTSCTRLTRAS